MRLGMQYAISMARTSTYPLVDRLLDGHLEAHLREQRTDGQSYENIARALLRDLDVDLSSATIRRWCIDLGIDPTEAAAS